MNPFVYRYDGSLEGLLCCLAECWRDKGLPVGIREGEEEQVSLYPVKEIGTDPDLARRAARYLRQKAGGEVWECFRLGTLTCMEHREMALLRLALLGVQQGPGVMREITHPVVHAVDRALRYLENEAHFHRELLRFSELEGVLTARITPNNNVLPLIVGHFGDRLNGEEFVIYDPGHQVGYYHPAGQRGDFFRAQGLELPEPGEDERRYRALWKQFYNHIAVEGRLNPKLRQSHMPLRYWKNLTEFQEEEPAKKIELGGDLW